MPGMICGKGHHSTETDYCSECGVRLDGAPAAGVASKAAVGSAPAVYPGEICPDCGTLREQKDKGYCEVCGYNFVTGAHGEIPVDPETSTQAEVPEPGPIAPSQQPQGWMITVTLDPGLASAESPAPPADFVSASMDLEGTALLIGRGDEARGVHPEIALPFDEAISRRHALLHREAVGAPWQLRDVGASNGTRLNGKQLTALTDYALEDGDEITLGHWTRLRLEGR